MIISLRGNGIGAEGCNSLSRALESGNCSGLTSLKYDYYDMMYC